ncbi:uncharacterized protein LOC132202108 [Neocloeon triangulifer]|uniref:uncharacterized protein LOC132202108 n=1 Tax=Neocloeon triangulifer TaxID=2078957 RepID=UPI00286FAD91|nr:uncharacterized protein LOC132202108 [Neocloeon triangulifer]
MKCVTVVMFAVVLVCAADACFWGGKSKQQQTPEWLTKESLSEFNSALDKNQKKRTRRDTSEEEVAVTPTPTTSERASSFWEKISKGVSNAYEKAKEDAKTIKDRLEENLGI